MVESAREPELVPVKIPPLSSGLQFQLPEVLSHLRWLLQKSLLKQDIFLIGCENVSHEVSFDDVLPSVSLLLCLIPPLNGFWSLLVRF